MKIKKLNKKLNLNKTTLANLNQSYMQKVNGGAETDATCVGASCVSRCASQCCGGTIAGPNCGPNTYMDQTCPATYRPFCK